MNLVVDLKHIRDHSNITLTISENEVKEAVALWLERHGVVTNSKNLKAIYRNDGGDHDDADIQFDGFTHSFRGSVLIGVDV